MIEILKGKLIESMKSKDRFRTTTIRTIIASLQKNEKDSSKQLTDEDHIIILKGLAKRYRQSITQFSDGGRIDLVDIEKKELAILEEFLPAQATKDQILQVINEIISSMDSSSDYNFGTVMGLAMKKLSGNADGKEVQEAVKKVLGGHN
tara:strand:- start:17 stop:463 length:447 start_codon:yes stop_codon:yes gene_type:complete